jgi:BirA family biotin operon repressor/biotin-[acetyl-CoA-carboxylase] ligase
MRDLAFQVLRRLGNGEFQSGEVLARSLQVSRSVISAALKRAEEYGVRLYRIRGRGYCLESPVEFIDADQVVRLLGSVAGSLRLEVIDQAESTNTLVGRRAVLGESNGLCVLAEFQSAGRGRLGRSWHSGLGGALTFSLLWRFDRGASHLGGLSLAVSVGVLRGLRQVGIEAAAVKWPNDIVVNFRKLAGILIETQGDMLGPCVAVIGIGLNYRLQDDVKERIDQPVVDIASVAGIPVSRNVLFAAVLKNVVEVLKGFEHDGFAPLREEWQSAHAYHGRAVRIIRPAGPVFSAVVDGVGDDGALHVKTGKQLTRLASAEISLRTP